MTVFEVSQVVREGKMLGSDEGKAMGCALLMESSAWCLQCSIEILILKLGGLC
jgi:hypothetical protein